MVLEVVLVVLEVVLQLLLLQLLLLQLLLLQLPDEGTVDQEKMCRYCFQEEGDLISPCSCKGGQKWVHLQCLRKWQRRVSLVGIFTISSNPEGL